MTTATDILAEASSIVTGARQDTYGPPERNFQAIAAMWSVFLGHPINEEQVCICMALLKIARTASGHGSADNFVDLAGYGALAGEMHRLSIEGEKP